MHGVVTSTRYEFITRGTKPDDAETGEKPQRTLSAAHRAETRTPEPDDAGGAVEFRALGPIEAMVGGHVVDLGTPKQRALLALLVSRVGEPVAVDTMLEALWAGHPPPSATTSLQAYVANLRRVLEPDRPPRTPPRVLRTFPRGYVLDSRAVEVDVHRFDEHATAGWRAWDRNDPHRALSEFEAALALWRGEPYAEVGHAEWVAPEVSRLEELRLSVVEVRCAALLAVGAHELAGAELEAFLQAHPLREHGCELLALALYRAGRQADALDVLRTVQARLVEELGIDPRPALKQLEHEILNQSPALDRQPSPTSPSPAFSGGSVEVSRTRTPDPGDSPSPVADEDIFVGREEALRALTEALREVKAGRGRVVTVSGETGIGKTSLLRRFAASVGVPVLCGSCPEHVTAPALWPWEQVLRSAAARMPDHPVPAPVADWLGGDVGESEDSADTAAATLRRFEAIVHYLTGAARHDPLVVMLDQAHRADPSSLRLLAHLAESLPTSRLLVILAHRSDTAVRLAEPLAALARAGMTRIELDGLDAADTRTLVDALLARDADEHAAERLWVRAGGNPFFLRELIKLWPGDQHADQSRAVPVPVAVREVVLRRIARLPDAAAEILSMAAVVGRHFDVAVVADAASTGMEEVLEALDSAVAGGLVAEDQRQLGWFHFTHAMTAEVLHDTIGRLRRARLHRRIGAAAARLWAGNAERAAEIARHWLLAAELDPTAAAHASSHAAAAARVADARSAPEDAIVLWRHALTAAELADQGGHDRHPLLIGLGTSLYRAGNPRDGHAVFIEAVESVLGTRSEVDSSRLTAAAIAAVGEWSLYLGEHGDADPRLVDVLERALSRVTHPVPRALLLSCLAVARYYDSDPVHRAALSAEALDLVRLTTDEVALAHVLHLRATALAGPDYLDERLRAVTELLSLPCLTPLLAARARQLRARMLVPLGLIADARVEWELVAAHADEHHAPRHARPAWFRAGLLLLGGRWREAEERSRITYERHPPMVWGSARASRLVQRWEAAYLLGGGGELVEESRAVAESTGVPVARNILVMALIEAGRTEEARIALRGLPQRPKDDLWLYLRCWELLAASRLGEVGLTTRLREQLTPYRHLACSLSDLVISGPVAYFTAEAAVALEEPAAASADLTIATATARRMGSLPWLTRVCAAVRRVEVQVSSRADDSVVRCGVGSAPIAQSAVVSRVPPSCGAGAESPALPRWR